MATMTQRLSPRWRRRAGATPIALAALLLARCAAGPTPAVPGHAIVACGQRFDVGTRVVLWDEPGGYDAYREGPCFGGAPDGKRRYGERDRRPETLDELRQVVHAFVLHYDACGTSRQCFKVLQDKRTLSVHFLLDLDGTIYQTIDLKERAWHATIANDFSVGVEIAHPGAYADPQGPDLREWYAADASGPLLRFPAWLQETGVRPGFVARPARPELVTGTVQGQRLCQYDFTPEQYEALAKLCAGLSRALPRIRLAAPRAADGQVVAHKLPDAELLAFDGIIGHLHVQTNKVDPGPALQWDRLLERARQLRR
jgi:N-acetyl-anhydromuramyl-L-alanine amidase AmpD